MRITKKIKSAHHFIENLKKTQKEIKEYFFNDLNVPSALNRLFILAHYINDQNKDFTEDDKEEIIKIFKEADKVLGLKLIDESKIPKSIEILAQKRQRAKLEHNFEKSDIIRKKIEKEGYKIEDLKGNEYRIISARGGSALGGRI